MRKIVIAVMGTLSALVLVVSFDASRRGDVATAVDRETSDEGGAAADEAVPDGQDAPPPPPSTSTRTGVSGTFLGKEVETHWGIVQVEITVKNGRITKAEAVRYPDENHKDKEINSWAVPELQRMTVGNQGKIDSLSGATVTSEGYQESLQSALDQAHL